MDVNQEFNMLSKRVCPHGVRNGGNAYIKVYIFLVVRKTEVISKEYINFRKKPPRSLRGLDPTLEFKVLLPLYYAFRTFLVEYVLDPNNSS